MMPVSCEVCGRCKCRRGVQRRPRLQPTTLRSQSWCADASAVTTELQNGGCGELPFLHRPLQEPRGMINLVLHQCVARMSLMVRLHSITAP